MGWGRTRDRSLARAAARAAGTGDHALQRARSRRTESPLRPAEHPLATRGAQHTQIMRRRTECTPHWQGTQPEQRGRSASTKSAKQNPGCGRAVGHAVQGHPHRNPRVAPRTPAARVGLHQTLANSRETAHTIPKCLGTRAHRPRWNHAHTAAARPETQGHALPRAPSLLLSPRHWARRKPAAPSVAHRPSPRAFRRGSSNDLPRNGPRKLTGARTLQACNRVRFRREQPCNSATPCSASSHALLHAWSPKARP